MRWESLGNLLHDVKSGFASGANDENGVAQVRMNNITRQGEWDWSSVRRVPRPSKNFEAQLIQDGDILFNSTNSPNLVGKAAIFRNFPEPVTFSNHFLRLRPNPLLVSGAYLSRWLNLQFQRRIFEGMCTQWVNQASVRREDLLAMQIPLMSLADQRRIAAILDQADGLRRMRREALSRFDALISSSFYTMFGDVAENPFHWPKESLGDLAQKFSDGPFGSNLKSSHYVEQGIRVIRLQNIGIGRLLDRDRAFISEDHYASLPRHHCQPGDILIATLGDPNLRACILPITISKALNKADCVQMRVDESKVTREYICALLNVPSTLVLASSLILGQTRLRISMGRLRELEVPVPPLDLQKRFSNIVSNLEADRVRFAEGLLQQDALFASLQERAFNGEL